LFASALRHARIGTHTGLQIALLRCCTTRWALATTTIGPTLLASASWNAGGIDALPVVIALEATRAAGLTLIPASVGPTLLASASRNAGGIDALPVVIALEATRAAGLTLIPASIGPTLLAGASRNALGLALIARAQEE
jgi:hypothetical protein